MDVDGDGTVDFIEFLHMMAEQKKEMLQINNNNDNNNDCDEDGEMKQAFDMFDKDGNGFICASELKLVIPYSL